MTIREAVELVIIASIDSSKGESGEIHVLEMGEPIKIKDLARKMIKLSGQKKEIPIIYTKLRKGEKINEELFYNKENVSKTKNNFILKTTKKINQISEMDIEQFLSDLNKGEEKKILKSFFKLLPEYKRRIDNEKH